MIEIDKRNITIGELESLHPAINLFDGVKFESTKYYKDENNKLWEISICADGTLKNRVDNLEHLHKLNKIAKSFEVL